MNMTTAGKKHYFRSFQILNDGSFELVPIQLIGVMNVAPQDRSRKAALYIVGVYGVPVNTHSIEQAGNFLSRMMYVIDDSSFCSGLKLDTLITSLLAHGLRLVVGSTHMKVMNYVIPISCRCDKIG